MIDILLYALGLCIVVVLSISITAIVYLPIVSVVYMVLSPDKKTSATNPWRHWLQFSIGELLLLILIFSIALAFKNFAVSVTAIAIFISHGTGKRATTNTPASLKRAFYWFFFSSIFGWVIFGAYGASSQYYRAATRWEIFSSGSWQNALSVVFDDLLNFTTYGLWGLLGSSMCVATLLLLHAMLKSPRHTP